MAAADKLLERMRANLRDWRIEDVARACQTAGIACTAPRGGSHYKVKHPTMTDILTIPTHRPIKPVYIRDLVRFIDTVRAVG